VCFYFCECFLWTSCLVPFTSTARLGPWPVLANVSPGLSPMAGSISAACRVCARSRSASDRSISDFPNTPSGLCFYEPLAGRTSPDPVVCEWLGISLNQSTPVKQSTQRRLSSAAVFIVSPSFSFVVLAGDDPSQHLPDRKQSCDLYCSLSPVTFVIDIYFSASNPGLTFDRVSQPYARPWTGSGEPRLSGFSPPTGKTPHMCALLPVDPLLSFVFRLARTMAGHSP